MKITKIETIPITMPINPERAIRSGRGYHTKSPFVLIKIYTDQGVVGLGEVSCTPQWSGECQTAAVVLIEEYLAPVLVGEDPTRIEYLVGLISKTVANNPFTRSGLEMALWDILGKVAGLPVYQLLGGAIRDFVPTKFSVSGLEPERAAEIASWAASQGFRAMKVKVGIEPEADVARVEAVRKAVGTEVRLGVDANGGWSPRVALRIIPRLQAWDVYFVEQPVPDLDIAWMADVRQQVDLPIMADESIYNLQDAMAIVRANAADILSVYVGKGGGISTARKIASVAEAAGLVCTVGSNLELGIGNAAMIHLALSTPAIDAETFPCDILSPFYYDQDILVEPLPIQAGRANAPVGAGLGVELDDNKVDFFRVR